MAINPPLRIFQCLCPSATAQECEKNAEFVAKTINVPERRKAHKGAPTDTRAEIMQQLARVQGGSSVLARVVAKGVAFHNAGQRWLLSPWCMQSLWGKGMMQPEDDVPPR